MKNKTDELFTLLGQTCYTMYERLNHYITDHYNVDQIWDNGGKYGDTVLRYSRSGKTLCTLYFREHQLGIWIILGKDERVIFEQMKTNFSEAVQTKYDQTDVLHDGKWLTFDESDDTLFKDIVLLLSVKKAPNRKLTRCGYCCDLCKAFIGNQKKKDERAELSAYWQQYYDLHIPTDDIKCDGCLCKKADAHRIDMSCPVRACVLEKQLEDCSQCESYPCDKFMSRKGLSLAEANEIKKLDIPSYYKYLCAYDNQSRLNRKQNDKSL